MKVFCLALLALVAAASAKEVQVLTDANLADTIANNQFVLVEFYAPWCGHCKKLEPEYNQAAEALGSYEPAVVLGKVDATEEKVSGEKYGIKGYPTLKWFNNGVISEYEGGRTAPEIVSWIKKKTGPPAIVLDDENSVRAWAAGNQIVAVGFFAEGADVTAFNAAASASDIDFGITYSKNAAEKFGVTAPALVVVRKFDEPEVPYTGAMDDATAIGDFVGANALPLVVSFEDRSVMQKVFGGKIDTHLIVFRGEEAADAALTTTTTAAARGLKGELIAVMVANTEESKDVKAYFGITAETPLPAARIFHGGKKYEFEGDLVADSDGAALIAFHAAFKAGTVVPKLKSAEPPADNSGPVTIVTGKTYNDIVYKSGNAVFIELYAPWCGHCKALTPKWEELGKMYKEVDGVTIAMMDATENEAEGVDIKGFPTLFFYKAGAKAGEHEVFSGARETKDLAEYVEKMTGKAPGGGAAAATGDHSEL